MRCRFQTRKSAFIAIARGFPALPNQLRSLVLSIERQPEKIRAKPHGGPVKRRYVLCMMSSVMFMCLLREIEMGPAVRRVGASGLEET
jgi:hypothetical protein